MPIFNIPLYFAVILSFEYVLPGCVANVGISWVIHYPAARVGLECPTAPFAQDVVHTIPQLLSDALLLMYVC